MRAIKFSADHLVNALLAMPKERNLCLLDSCGVSHSGSHLLIAGFDPIETMEISEENTTDSLKILDDKLSQENLASFLTISYDFGLKLDRISPRKKEFPAFQEPDIFLALFDCLIIHDYDTHKTYLIGNKRKFDETEKLLSNSVNPPDSPNSLNSSVSSNFTRESYISAIERIQEYIRDGDTYQTNLTQQLRARLPEGLTPEEIFVNLRKNHPAPFASFIRRKNDTVVSASPERFFKIQGSKFEVQGLESEIESRIITAAPIKGTRPRGKNIEEDSRLKNELLNSSKDRAENVMIVDLLRNDIGRICEFGSVEVEKLCELETHPTLYHLVSTVRGKLREEVRFSDILKAVFPCGSITGAPKIRTMQIIDEIETAPRGLSMGAIGFSVQNSSFQIQNPGIPHLPVINHHYSDLNVAIRTMVIRENEAIFNVGGGIVIDSIPEEEYKETLVKARALLNSINAKNDF